MVPFSLPLLDARRDFFFLSLILTLRSCQDPGVKTHKKVEASLWLGSPGVFISQTFSEFCLQQFVNYSSHFPTLTSFFSVVSCNLLYWPVSFSNFGGKSLPFDFTFSRDLRRGDFLVCLAFWIRTEWGIQSFLQARWETGHINCFSSKNGVL